MTESASPYRPVSADGDAILRGPGVAGTMDSIFQHGMLPDGSFAVTDGIERPDGSLSVYADATGEHVAESIIRSGEHPAAVAGYGDRLRLAAQPELYESQSVQRGETRKLGNTPETLLLNGQGALGEANLIGLVKSAADDPKLQRTYGLIELNGRLFQVTRQTNTAGMTGYFPQEVTGQPDDRLRGPIQVGIEAEQDLRTVRISAKTDQTAELHVPGAERVHEQQKRGVVRGVLRGRRQRQAHETRGDSNDFDINEAQQAIVTELASQERMDRELKEAVRRQEAEQQIEESRRQALSIQEQSAQFPEAGNLFTPGASVFEDPLFRRHMEGLGIGEVREVAGKTQIVLSDSDRERLRTDTAARDTVKQYLRARIDAWCKSEPAARIKHITGAYRRLQDHEGLLDANSVRHQYPEDSFMHYASDNRPTIANTLVPSGVYDNREVNTAGFDHPRTMRSRDYAASIGLALINGSFNVDRQENLHDDQRFTDDKGRIVIHRAGIAQHRSAAHMAVYGSY